MKVIVTRPEPDGPVLAGRLARLGYEAVQAHPEVREAYLGHAMAAC